MVLRAGQRSQGPRLLKMLLHGVIGGAHTAWWGSCGGRPQRMKKFVKIAIVALIMMLSNLLGYFSLTAGHVWNGDFPAYYMQAKSLVNGTIPEFIAHSTFTANHSAISPGPILYPWGYPLLLAIASGFWGFDLMVFKMLNLVCFDVFLVSLFYLFSNRLSFMQNIGLVSIFAWNPSLLRLQDSIMSDLPFLACSTVFMVLLDRIVGRDQIFLSPVIDRILMGLAGFGAFFIRANGILLFFTLLFCELRPFLRKGCLPSAAKQKIPLQGLPYLTGMMLWWGFSRLLPAGDVARFNYFEHLSCNLVISNLKNCLLAFHEFFAGSVLSSLSIYAVALIFFAIGISQRHELRQNDHFYSYALLTLGLYTLWPSFQGLRFLLPILPFFLYGVASGFLLTLRKMSASGLRRSSLAGSAMCLLLILDWGYSSARHAYANVSQGRIVYGPFEPASLAMFDFIAHATKPDDVIVFFKPREMTMMTDRRALMLTAPLALQQTNYVVIHKRVSNPYFQIPLETLREYEQPLHLRSIYENPKFIVYQIGHSLQLQ